MPIDYHRLVDGLSAATRMLDTGVDPLTVVDTVLTAAKEATGAAGATLIEFADSGGRITSACGAMTWATGQPVAERLVEREERGYWSHLTAELPGRAGPMLMDRGLLACVGFGVRAGGPPYGSVNLFFDQDTPADWPTMEPVLRLVAAVLARTYAPPPLETRAAGVEEDDRTLFLAVAGHELRTPVTVVKGYATMLADRWDSLDESNRRAAAQVLAQRADEMARLVDRMLTASVGDGAGRLVRTVAFDAVEVVNQSVLGLPGDHRAVLRLDLPDRLPAAHGDPAMLPAILAELVTNALRHSAEAEPVEVTAGADPQTVFLRVSDRGLGIDPAHVERAFERFWRAARDTDPRNGVGLGLYLVRRLVERQQGWVSLRPRDGGGTVAEVRLPRADAIGVPVAVPPMPPVPLGAVPPMRVGG